MISWHSNSLYFKINQGQSNLFLLISKICKKSKSKFVSASEQSWSNRVCYNVWSAQWLLDHICWFHCKWSYRYESFIFRKTVMAKPIRKLMNVHVWLIIYIYGSSVDVYYSNFKLDLTLLRNLKDIVTL